MSNRKQSVLVGGLISSAGIFISKFLSLLYVIPFNSILQTAENQSYYSQTYNIYAYVLTIATAGLPSAIAILIAKYSAREDYRTCLLVKKISFITMAIFGFICMSVMILCSTMIANQICPDEGEITIMRNAIVLISFALFIIPILSSLRGFYQGLKEFEIYSLSQVLEQIVRIVFLLSIGAILVFVFNQDAVWAMYFSIFAASIAGLLTIFFVRWKGNKKLSEIKRLAKEQEFDSTLTSSNIFRELLLISIPFLLNSIFGYCDTIINQMDLKPGLEAFGQMAYSAELTSAIYMHATKIIAIPMVLTPGFAAALIPYITSAREKGNIALVRKYIIDCIESVLYIALPVCLALFVFAQPISFALFGGSNLELDTFALKWYSLEALFATICPIFSSILVAIGFRRKTVINTMIFAFIKLAVNRLFISWWGVPGMIISSFLAYTIFTIINVYVIQKHYKVNWIYTFRKLLFISLGLLGFYLLSFVFNFAGWITYVDSRFISLVLLGVMGIVCMGVYFGITAFCNIPQSIFHFQIKDTLNKIIAKVKR